MVCRALAADFDVPMLLVQPSDIFDKYLGESEKLAKAVFVSYSNLFVAIIRIDFQLRVLLTKLRLVSFLLTKSTRCLALGAKKIPVVQFVEPWSVCLLVLSHERETKIP